MVAVVVVATPRHGRGDVVALTVGQEKIARRLLEDGCSYREVGRTLGVCHSTVRNRIPGFGWSYAEAGRFAMTLRWAS